jgi:hypothetical protein
MRKLVATITFCSLVAGLFASPVLSPTRATNRTTADGLGAQPFVQVLQIADGLGAQPFATPTVVA